MKKNKIIIITLAGILLLVSLAIIFHKNPAQRIVEMKADPRFAEYVNAYTAGFISSESNIRIRFTKDIVAMESVGRIVEQDLFSFSPKIEGSASWIDTRTIEFIPEKKLPSGKTFNARLKINEIIDVPDELENFDFGFQVIQQNFNIQIDNVKAYDNYKTDIQELNGTIRTADIVIDENIEKVLEAFQNGKKLNIEWEHSEDRKTHSFRVDSIKRKTTSAEVKIQWDGSHILVDEKGEKIVIIEPLSVFKLRKAYVKYEPAQHVVLQFSDPLEEAQELDGLIKIPGIYYLRFDIEDNEIRVFTDNLNSGEEKIEVSRAIENINGKKLGRNYIKDIIFDEHKPSVRMTGKGVILPNSQGLIFPFEAVNLRAVDVVIIKIFEDNMAQFLQINELDGERELYRVGQVILKKRISLINTDVVNYNKWNRFYLDLSEIIQSDPGAIYKVVFGFKQEYSMFHCSGESSTDNMVELTYETNSEIGYHNGYFDYNDLFGTSDYNDYYGYTWDDRNNPCKKAYYSMYKHAVGKNILASDLGLISKKGSDGSIITFVSNLITAEPESGVLVELYDFQGQKIDQQKTDVDGKATFHPKKPTYLVIAKKNEQRGYLKLSDGTSLSMSMFEVGGTTVNHGLKGFIYGERGVWRPGDSIFLSFMIEDQLDIPESHPIVFELFNPLGQSDQKIIKYRNEHDFYTYRIKTDAEAPTGNWQAKISIGDAVFTQIIKIETIMPNRLKINLDFSKDKLLASQGSIQGDLSVKWLHGAVARKLKAKVDLTLSRKNTSFSGYESYIFDDPASNFSTEQHTIFEQRINEDGTAKIKSDISIRQIAPGALNAHFAVKVFEEGGAYSVDGFSLPYYPYERYVGIKAPEGDSYTGMLETDKEHIFEIVNLTAEGKPVAANNLEAEVYKINWRWWWDRSEENLSNYLNSYYYQPIKTGKALVKNGKAKFSLRINQPDWGRYLVRITDKTSGHSTGKTVYIDWPGWRSRDSKEDKTAASLLTFVADKEKYTVGEEIKLTIPGAKNGRALISIENGKNVISSFWKETDAGEMQVSFKATKEMAPNVYINITLIQPHAQVQNDLPIRLYGVIPVYVENPNTHLVPEIRTSSVYRPESKAKISISEKHGNAMAYTLAVVDEGLLDLTRFLTPNPWQYFYSKEALGVKTWDVYDYVMGAYGGDLERILAIGGGEQATGGKMAKANRFKPMVKFLGPFELKKGSKNEHIIEIPQYIGSVRIMAIARDGNAFGNSEMTVPVRKPLMVLSTLPRVLGPGEEVKLPVTVFAMEDHIKNVNVKIQTNDFFTIQESSSQKIYFDEKGDKVITFTLKVKEKLGVGKVNITATCGQETAKDQIELDIRNPNPEVVRVIDTVIEKGQVWTTDFSLFGLDGTNHVIIEASSMPSINLQKRLKYLLNYPHGCIEQTTSSAFPQLFLSELTEVSEKTKERTINNVKAAIERIKLFQTSDGGFSYWPGNYDSDQWSTSYAGHFLIEAEKKGFAVPNGMKKKWIHYQRKMTRQWTDIKNRYYDNHLMQAYRLYTLALAGQPENGAMNRLRESSYLSVKAKWRLAAAFQLAGKTKAANELINNLSADIKDYRQHAYSYGSALRDRAMILETMILLNQKSKAFTLLKSISKELSSTRWMSTQETAYCLLAVSMFTKGSKSEDINLRYSVNGKNQKTVKSGLPLYQEELKNLHTDNKIMVHNTGSGILFVRVVLEGIPPAGNETAFSNNLVLNVKYKTMDGNPLSPLSIKQGTDFLAEVTLMNPGFLGHYKQMALTHIFPSGWQIHNVRMDHTQSVWKSSHYDYQDLRDDRVYTYFNLSALHSKKFYVLLNASYAGRFYLPGVYCEAMYDAASIAAQTKGIWVNVVNDNF